MTCKETLEIGDDYGDNETTMHCQLEEGHAGRHQEVFFDGRAMVEWDSLAPQGAGEGGER